MFSERNRAVAAIVVLKTTIAEAIIHKEGGHIVETPVEARAGFLDRPVLVVLVVSIVLVVSVFALVAGGFFS